MPDRVICPLCQEERRQSRVYVGATTSTLAYRPAYYDEDGQLVVPPDPNTHTTEYQCSNGHRWVVQQHPRRL